MPTAEDIERHEAVAVVIAVKETLPLLPVHRDVRGIKVQHQPFKRLLVVSHELVEECLVQASGDGAVLLLFRATQCGRACQRAQTLAAYTEYGIEMQLIVVIQAFVAGGNGQQSLAHQLFSAVLDTGWAVRVIHDFGHRARQTKALVALT